MSEVQGRNREDEEMTDEIKEMNPILFERLIYQKQDGLGATLDPEEFEEIMTELIETRTEISRLTTENAALRDKSKWHEYIEGDTNTYPPIEDWYWIAIENEDDSKEYYSFDHGWATDKNIIGWAYQPSPAGGEL